VTSDERDIFQFLKTWGPVFTGANEICRRAAGKKKFYDDPHWAKSILTNMVERGILEKDNSGRFRIKPVPRKKHGEKWVAPEIAKLLEEKGIKANAEAPAEEGEHEIAEDEHYDQL
jgi:hypothetical protein